MGNKKKIGKARKDKFYHLAKETGYRARSAFKLIQLNRKFSFLEKSRVCLDLCAAPGGWSQVAANLMPVSSEIIAVDLVPIKPIPKVKTLVDDITTDKCRSDIRKELGDNRADVVLNDGAPNVGKNWLQDAFTQSGLTLYAMKLASEFLRKGGWFITKVFRSQDYHALIWVFKQLFNKVHATKPQASRNESAEIFVVCQGYKAPDKLDPKFLDPKAVFSQVEEENKDPESIFKTIRTKKRKPEGYTDGDYTQHTKLPVSKLFSKPNFMELLATANEVVFDDERVLNHKSTTEEIKECCKDIKVLNKTDVKGLLKWRKTLLTELTEEPEKQEEGKAEVETKDEDEEIDELINQVRADEEREAKRKSRKALKAKSKLRQKMDLKIVYKDEDLHEHASRSVFALKGLKTKNDLERVTELEGSDLEWEDSENEMDSASRENRPKYKIYDPAVPREDMMSDEDNGDSDDDFNDMEKLPDSLPEGPEQSDEEVPEGEGNPLMVALETKQEKMSRQAQLWLQKDAFDEVANEEVDEDFDLEKMITEYTKKGGKVKGRNQRNNVDEGPTRRTAKHDDTVETSVTSPKKERKRKAADMSPSEDSDTDSDSDSGSEPDYGKFRDKKKYKDGKLVEEKAGMEVVASTPTPKLDAFGLALGAKMIKSQKTKRDIMDMSYSRYAYHDENLPSWFVTDERKHIFRRIPVTKAEVDEYRQKMKEIDARPIKKIAEAKGRKKKRLVNKMEKARKKSEALDVAADGDPSAEKEKWHQIKSIYKKATREKRPEVKFVVAKKGGLNIPRGKKMRYKVVDGRMKTDTRKEKSKIGKGGKKKRGKGPSVPRGQKTGGRKGRR